MNFPPPEPPKWALDAGLPSPAPDENFVGYVTRLGLDARELTRDLDEVTADLCNVRLASLLQEEMADDFRLYVQGLVAESVPEDRQHWLENYQL